MSPWLPLDIDEPPCSNDAIIAQLQTTKFLMEEIVMRGEIAGDEHAIICACDVLIEYYSPKQWP